MKSDPLSYTYTYSSFRTMVYPYDPNMYMYMKYKKNE